jgi:hypothetical protein
MKLFAWVETLPVAVMRETASSKPSVLFMRTSKPWPPSALARSSRARDATRNGLKQQLTASRLARLSRDSRGGRLCPVDLTSDPHAWLRPYYVALKNDGVFWMLAMPQRFEALCCAVEGEHPSRAASMREWSPAVKEGILGWLESVTKEKASVEEVELWRVTKDTRELRCVARYLPAGLDLRVMQGDDFRRTELHKDAPSVQARAEEWRSALLERGW